MDLSRRVLLQMPTGAGKTTVATAIADEARAGGVGSIWFLAHRRELVSQAAERLSHAGAHVCSLQANRGVIEGFREGSTVVASIPTLVSVLRQRGSWPAEWGAPPGLLFMDEAHHVAADTWLECLKYLGDARVLGLSATPYRSDGSGLGCGFVDCVQGPTPRELVDLGVLVEPELYAARQMRNEIAGDPVEAYLERMAGEKAVCFSPTVAEAERMAARFRAAGVNAAMVEGNMGDDERERALDEWRNGATSVMVNCQLLTEGFDMPHLAGVILARSVRSEALFIQMIGRALRAARGKTRAWVLDHGGNLLRFGHPLADRPIDMHGRKERVLKPMDPNALRLCETCLVPFTRSEKLCPKCGLAPATRTPEENAEAKLKKLSEADFNRAPVAERRAAWSQILRSTVPGREGSWRACYRFKARFGRFPFEDNEVMSPEQIRRLKLVIFSRKGKA
jgi:superfamily II DNA or RNA helicase